MTSIALTQENAAPRAGSENLRPVSEKEPEAHSPSNYAVGLRVLWDRQLHRQIREELRSRTMTLADVARLENVSPNKLRRVLELSSSAQEEPSILLRHFADRQAGYETAAWRTSRKRLSKRHIVSPYGAALCGTPLGDAREWLDNGPCRTCAEHAGIELDV
jgi:hypothetical protein